MARLVWGRLFQTTLVQAGLGKVGSGQPGSGQISPGQTSPDQVRPGQPLDVCKAPGDNVDEEGERDPAVVLVQVLFVCV